MKKFIGIDLKGNRYFYNEKSANSGFIATGRSGYGKTQAIFSQAVQAAETGEKIIVINWRRTVTEDTVISELYERYEKLVCRHNVATEGLTLPLFSKHKTTAGNEESDMDLTARLTGLLSYTCGLNSTQKTALHTAICDIYRNGYYKNEGLEVICDWLNSQKSNTAKAVAGRLFPLCGFGKLKDGSFINDSKPIFEINLNGLEYDEQTLFAKFILCFIQREAMRGAFTKKPVTVFIDEVQNLLNGKRMQEPLEILLNEGRKLNIKLLLACPSLSGSAKNKNFTLMQCATTLFFQPIDEERVKLAKMIAPKESESINYVLSKLKVGECIAKGSFVVVTPDGKERTEEGVYRIQTKLSDAI